MQQFFKLILTCLNSLISAALYMVSAAPLQNAIPEATPILLYVCVILFYM